MPFIDWAGKEPHIKGFVYVSGHNHRNYFYDDGIMIGFQSTKMEFMK